MAHTMNHRPRRFLPLRPESLAAALAHAARLVARVRAGHTLSTGLEHLWQQEPELTPGQRGAIQDLAYTSLRAFGYAEALLAPLLHSPPPEPLYSLLLVALNRLEARPDIAHTLVDQCVQAAAAEFDGKLRGLVNAILRNYLRRAPELRNHAAAQEVAAWRHPAWWIARLRSAYPDQHQAILSAGNSHPPMALRTNLRRTSVEALRQRLTDEGIAATRGPGAALLLAEPQPVTRIPGFLEGWCSVQDPAAQRAAAALDLHPGQRVLDACAAPGGKSAHILEYCAVELTAIELSPARLRRVAENLDRLGLQAELRTADCRATEQWWDGRPFDRILADVPCSASGVVRRHPDIKWLRRNEDIPQFVKQQTEILERLWHTLVPGGKMLYATCSVFPEENSMQIERFVRNHANARRLALADGADGQLLPCAEHDGFFYALLEKNR